MNRPHRFLTALVLPLGFGCSDAAPGSVGGAGGGSAATGGVAAAGGSAVSMSAGASGAGGGDTGAAGGASRAGSAGAVPAGGGGGASGAAGNVATGGSGSGGVGSSGGPAQVRVGCESIEYDAHVYALCRDAKVAFPVARKDCVSMNMQLIRLDNAAESDWIYSTFYSKPATPGADGSQMWVGGTDTAVEGEWRWLIGGGEFWRGKADGMPLAGSFTYWGRAHGVGVQDQPNDAHSAEGEDCMVIRGPSENEAGKWTDISCADENQPPAPDTRLGWYTCESL